jgi:hypothetical protein
MLLSVALGGVLSELNQCYKMKKAKIHKVKPSGNSGGLFYYQLKHQTL